MRKNDFSQGLTRLTTTKGIHYDVKINTHRSRTPIVPALCLTAGERSDAVVVWATLDPSLGRAAIKSFVVPKGTPGMTVERLEHKLGIKASDTAAIRFEDCRVPAANLAAKDDTQQHAGDRRLFDMQVGYNDKTEVNGYRHTESLHVVERISRPDVNTLQYEATIEDPNVFAGPWVMKRTFPLLPEYDSINEFVCENNRDYKPLFGK